MSDVRIEKDSMGDVPVPESALWGAQTQRAVENFGVSNLRIHPFMLKGIAIVKKSAALVNCDLGRLDKKLCDAIVEAANEVIEHKHDQEFPIDVFQTGSGTSWNMNMNEVLSNRANQILGEPLGKRFPVHPNDHVNQGQSSNDTIPTALNIADRLMVEKTVEAVQRLGKEFRKKEKEFSTLVKLGRTHLQDAVPMTLGQEFSAFAVQMEKGAERLRSTYANLEELAQGGTALGTGLNAHPEFADKVAKQIAKETGVSFVSAPNKFEAIAVCDAQVELMGAVNVVAVAIMKIANDIRILSSGPRGALGEIILPELQPGSSIMPGKINPVIPEMLIQLSAHIQGKVVSVTIAGQNSPLQLNMMYPILAHETLSSLALLEHACDVFAERCVKGIKGDKERLEHWIGWSLALVTPLNRKIGYDKAAELAHKAYHENRKIEDVVREANILSEKEIQEILNPHNMV